MDPRRMDERLDRLERGEVPFEKIASEQCCDDDQELSGACGAPALKVSMSRGLCSR